MRLADATGLRIGGKDAIEARLNGQVVWSSQVDELQALLDEIALNAAPRSVMIPEPGILGQQRVWRLSDGTNAANASGDPVGRVDVVSADSNDFLQPVSAERPQYRLVDSLHSLYGDGSQTRLVTEQNVPWITSASAEAFYAVAFKRDSGSGAGYVSHCDLDVSDRTQQAFSVLSNVNGTDEVNVGGTPNTIATSANPIIVYLQFNKVTRTGVISWNGGSEIALNVGTVSRTNAPMRILARGGGAHILGNYYGQVAAEGVVPYATRRKVMSYLAKRAGVTL